MNNYELLEQFYKEQEEKDKDYKYYKCGMIIYDENNKPIEVIKDYYPYGCGNNGYIFKDSEAFENSLDKICYISEYGSLEENDFYTKQDFINICNGDEKMAYDLFNMVDWQHPETAFEELFNNEEDERE